MRNIIVVLAMIGVLVLVACTPQTISTEGDTAADKAAMQKTADEAVAVMEKKEAVEEPEAVSGAMVKPEMMAKYTGKALAGTSAPYLEFNKADYDRALAEGKTVLLYFYASWCPSCQKEQPEVFAAFDSLEANNIVGFRVNYKDSDTDADEEELAKEFGIAYQHTKVILSGGERVLKAPDTWDKERYLSELKNYG